MALVRGRQGGEDPWSVSGQRDAACKSSRTPQVDKWGAEVRIAATICPGTLLYVS